MRELLSEIQPRTCWINQLQRQMNGLPGKLARVQSEIRRVHGELRRVQRTMNQHPHQV